MVISKTTYLRIALKQEFRKAFDEEEKFVALFSEE